MSLGEQAVPDRQAYLYQSLRPPARIWLDFGVVDRIAAEALRGLSALPRRGIEVGGILLGRTGGQASAPEISILDCVAFDCEHLYGPNFHLSPKDRDALAAQLEELNAKRTQRLKPVGLYRTHTRGDLELTAEDIELMDAFFPGGDAVCLIVRPYAVRPADAAFFLRDHGALRPGAPDAVFVFRRKEMGGGATPRGAAAPPPPVDEPAGEPEASPPAAAFETELAEPERPAPPRGSYTWLWVIALVTFLMAGVAIGVQIAGGLARPAPPKPAPDPYSLGLSALQFGDAIHFRWNAQAPALEACRSASLVIRDGDNTKIIELQKEDIARGALIYRNASPNVQFRLEATLSPGNVVSETLQVRLLPQPGPAPQGGGDDSVK
jgi:hypothetical protein